MENIFKIVLLGAAFSITTATGDITSGNRNSPDDDRCEATRDLRISTAKLDIDRKGESEIQGKIINESDKTDYKSVKVRINFLDENGKEIGSMTKNLQGDFNDDSSENFTLKFNAPRGTEDANYYIECAVKS